MRYSQAVEWAVCILALLAFEKRIVTNEELHNRLRVSSSYLKKITRKLVVCNLIRSSHGVNGGFVLAKDMKDITLYDLVDAIDGSEAFFQTSGLIAAVFPERTREVNLGKKLLSGAFIEAQDKLNAKLKKTNMAQIVRALKKV